MELIPVEHIEDAHKLVADAKIDLYELTPSDSTGVIYFKNDDTVSWLGNEYTGLPVTVTGEAETSEGASPNPTMVIGQTNIDLSLFKPLIWSGSLDNAKIVRHKVLLDNILGNINKKETTTFRVKRVEKYDSFQISLILAGFAPTGPHTLPFRQYVPPEFPYIVI